MSRSFIKDKKICLLRNLRKKYDYCEIKKKIKGTTARGEPFYQGDILCGEKCFVNCMIFSAIIITIVFFMKTKVYALHQDLPDMDGLGLANQSDPYVKVF